MSPVPCEAEGPAEAPGVSLWLRGRPPTFAFAVEDDAAVPTPVEEDAAADPPARLLPSTPYGELSTLFMISLASGSLAAVSRSARARGSRVARRMPRRASVWCRRASMASMYPFGGPRLREGPRKVHAVGEGRVSVLRWEMAVEKW